MQRRPGRGTIRPVAIRDDGCARCGTELEPKAVQVYVEAGRLCWGCWKAGGPWGTFHVEYQGDPEGTPLDAQERVGEGANVPGVGRHTHELEVSGYRIRIIGCPGCIVGPVDWQGPTNEEWLRRFEVKP